MIDAPLIRPMPQKAINDENARSGSLSPTPRSTRGLKSSDGLRNAGASATSNPMHKPLPSRARPQIRFQEQTTAISPPAIVAHSSATPFVSTGSAERKLLAGRTPHHLSNAGVDDEDLTQGKPAALSPLPLGSLFNYDYSYQSVVKPVRVPAVPAQENPVSPPVNSVQGQMHGIRLSPSPLPQRSRPPSDQFTMESSNPSPMKQQTVTEKETRRTFAPSPVRNEPNLPSFPASDVVNAVGDDASARPSLTTAFAIPNQHEQQHSVSYTDIFGSASVESPEKGFSLLPPAPSAVALSPLPRAPISSFHEDRLREETRGPTANTPFARATSAPPLSPSVQHQDYMRTNTAEVRPSADDSGLFANARPQAPPGRAAHNHHLAIPSIHGLDTRAPVGKYRTDIERASLYTGKLNHFDEYQRLLAAAGATAKSATIKMGMDQGVSLSRPGLGTRKGDAPPPPGPPDAARNLTAGAACPRPEWNEKQREALLNQAPQVARADIAVPVDETKTAPEETRLAAFKSSVASVAAYRSANVLDDVNFDVSVDSSLGGNSPITRRKGAVISRVNANTYKGLTAQLDDTQDESAHFGLDKVMASLKRHDNAIESKKKTIVKPVAIRPAVASSFRPPAPIPASGMSSRLGGARRVKTSQRHDYDDADTSDIGIGSSNVMASPVLRRGEGRYGGTRARDLSDEDSDITFDAEQVFLKDRQSVVSFSVDVGLHDGTGASGSDESGLAYLDASYNNVNMASLTQYPTDADTSALSTIATTISVDNSFLDEDSFGNGTAAPRLVVGPRRRRAGGTMSSDDMKEITLQCVPGEFNTIVLTFSNKRTSKLILRPRAILVRFDRTISGDLADRAADVSTATAGPSGNIFQVSPSLMSLQSGESGNLYITFSPTQDVEGIYGGALKIKSKGKSFVLLLRGEAKKAAKVEQAARVLEPQQAAFVQAVQNDPAYDAVLPSSFSAAPQSRAADAEIFTSQHTPATKAPCDPLLSRTMWLRSWLQKERQAVSMVVLKPDWKVTVPETLSLTMDHTGVPYKGELLLRNSASREVHLSLSVSKNSITLPVSDVVVSAFGELRLSVAVVNDAALGDSSLPSCHLGYIMVSEQGVREAVVEVRLELRPRTLPSAATPGFFRMYGRTPTPLRRQTPSMHTVDSAEAVRVRASAAQSGVFFRSQSLNFGSVAVGAICQQRVQLCNATTSAVVVYLSDPCLPFVLERNEITIRSNSYVNVVVRFVPGMIKESTAEMFAQTVDGAYHFKTSLIGQGV